MFAPIEIELTSEERDRLLDRMAHEVCKRRMEVPAVLALEMHRPLTFLGSQALVVFTPMLAPALGLENLQRLSKLMEDRRNLDRLIDRIEELSWQARGSEKRPAEPVATQEVLPGGASPDNPSTRSAGTRALRNPQWEEE